MARPHRTPSGARECRREIETKAVDAAKVRPGGKVSMMSRTTGARSIARILPQPESLT